MIKGLHALFHSPEADATRAFIKEKLDLPCVDDGGGWLIFGLDKAELGVHPAESAPSHQISFWCDDIDETVATLKERGVEFTKPVWDEPWGRVTVFKIPGGLEVMLYEPKHAQP